MGLKRKANLNIRPVRNLRLTMVFRTDLDPGELFHRVAAVSEEIGVELIEGKCGLASIPDETERYDSRVEHFDVTKKTATPRDGKGVTSRK